MIYEIVPLNFNKIIDEASENKNTKDFGTLNHLNEFKY